MKCPKCGQMEKTKNGFHRGKQISVINWVKQFASKFKNIPKKCEKVDIIELDEMCVSSKKNMALDCCKQKD